MMLFYEIDLDGEWEFASLNGSIHGVGSVPGDIYNDLLHAKVIEPPLYRDNDVQSRWVSLTKWDYSRKFKLDENQLKSFSLKLQLDGLDTVASIYVNDQMVGSTMNQFIQYEFDIKKVAQLGNNTIRISFQSPVTYAKSEADKFKKKFNHEISPECPPSLFRGECHGNMIRKVQSSFSWDWGPAFPTMGIWQSIRVVLMEESMLRSVHLRVDSQKDDSFVIFVESLVECHSQCQLNVNIPELKIKEKFSAVNGSNTFQIQIQRNNIELWFPNGYGQQKMYDVHVSLDGKENIQIKKIGFRSVELVQDFVDEKNKEKGRHFYFKVNNITVFLKGSNWIPVSAFPAQNNTRRMKFLMKSSQIVGMNAMRVWGGGRYEDDLFYSLADEYGILIWHDLMFACSLYPTHPEFLATVKEEITQNVNRLKHHPSILIWAGNNENELGLHDGWFSGASMDIQKKEYKTLYLELAKTVISNLDPARPYVLSSPGNGMKTEEEGGISKDPGSEYYGDIHFYNEYLNLWEDRSYRTPRCSTEYGVQSFPSKTTIMNYLTASDYSYGSQQWLSRQHHPGGTENNLVMIFSHFPIPNECGNFSNVAQCPFTNSSSFMDRFTYFSQAHQAIAYKVQTEHYRRKMNVIDEDGRGNTMCALYWQLNDIWAAPTWSSIDYDLRWKMSHYEAGRFFQPIHTVLFFIESNVLVSLVNDLPVLQSVTVKLDMLAWNNGFQPIYSVNETVRVPASSAKELTLGERLKQTKTAPEDFVYTATMFNEKGIQIGESSVLLPEALFRVPLENYGDVRVTSFTKISLYRYEIVLSTSKISPFTWINVNVTFLGHFSDNGFTMISKTRKVALILSEPKELAESNFSVCNLKTCGASVPFL